MKFKAYLSKVNNCRLFKDFSRFCIYFLFIFVAYYLFLKPYYTSDFGALVNKDLVHSYSHPNIINLITSGRAVSLVMYGPLWLFAKMGITALENAWVMQIIGMLLYALCAVIVYKMIARVLKTRDIVIIRDFIIDVCILLMFINPFVTETYVYGAMHWAVGVLAACLGAYYWTGAKYIRGFLCGVFATSFYQSNIIIMLVLCLSVYMLEGIENNSLTRGFKKCCIVSLVCATECALVIVIQKIAIKVFTVKVPNKNLSVGQAFNLLDSARAIIISVGIFLILTYGFAPIYFSFFVFVFSIIVGVLIYSKRFKEKWLDIGIWCIYCVCMALIPYSLVLATGACPGQRVVFSIFFGIGGMILCVSRILQLSNKKNYGDIISRIFIILSVLVYVIYTEIGISDCFIQQALDRQEVKLVENEIEKYQKDTGIKVTKIMSMSDSDPLYLYSDQILNYYAITYNHRMLRDSWSQAPYLNYVCGTDYETGHMSEEQYQKYFGDKQWDILDLSQQLHFEDDVLYWAVY